MTTVTKFKLKTTGRLYIALEHTINKDVVYGHIDKDGKSHGRIRSFKKEKIEFI